jgi:C_GCAxxG_C_C family probable redox protein
LDTIDTSQYPDIQIERHCQIRRREAAPETTQHRRSIMNREQVEQRAYEHFQGGLICAESVLLAVLEAAGEPAEGFAPGIATCFGGGAGRSKEEMCGALAGGLMALGLLRGRGQGRNWDEIAPTAAEYRRRVQALCGHTCCKDVLEALGPQENLEKCKRFTASAAGILHEMLGQEAPGQDGLSCGCSAS